MAYESWIEKHFHDKGRDEGWAEGEKQGRAEGEKCGIIKGFASLMRQGLLSLKDAAKNANMTEDEFMAQMAALGV